MWIFLQWIITIFFIVSLILLKTTPEDSEKYNKIRSIFIISALLFGILVGVFIIDILFSIWVESINDFFASFSGMP